jgi:hypothetical protein
VGAAVPPGAVAPGAGVTSAVGEVVTFGVTTGDSETFAVGVTFGEGEGSGFAVHPVSIAAAKTAASAAAMVFLISSFIPFAVTTLLLWRGARVLCASHGRGRLFKSDEKNTLQNANTWYTN